MFDVIERLKREWTDKYVVVESPAPELARFGTATGLVRTVNMNGRCLVEFDQFNNIGWYDIDPGSLKIVPKPEPKPEGEKAAKPAAKPAAEKPAAAKPAAAKPAAKGAPGKPSTADILAAARGKAATAKPAAEAKPAGKLSTAEILAKARAAKAAASEPVAATPVESEEPVAEAAPPAKKSTKPAAGGDLPTTTAEKIAWCRANDAKA